jgi:hypothetical protein
LADTLGQSARLPIPFTIATVMTLANRIKAVLTAAAFCAAFIAVDWVWRFPYTFPDLENYRTGFESGWYLFSVINLNWIQFILAEGPWVYGFDALWRMTGNIDTSFYIISCVATFLIVLYIYMRTQSYIAVIFIANPAFVHLVIEQIRSGLATGLFLIATLIKRRWLQAPLLLAALSIHTSFVFFVVFYYAYTLLSKIEIKKFLDKNFVISMIGVFVFAFVISYFRDSALSAFGDGRAFVQDDQTSGILLGLGWFLFIVSFYLLRKREEYSLDLYFFSLNVFMFISSILMGTYGSRFVAIGIPALAAMSRHVRDRQRPIFYAHYFLFSAFYFIVWAGV